MPLQPELPLNLQPASTHPWHWEEDGTVLVWEDGTTLAFLNELEELGRQTTQGRLPSLACVALVLAACRGLTPSMKRLRAGGFPEATLEWAVRMLRQLQTLPKDLLTVRGKAAIMEFVADRHKLPTYFVAGAVEDWRDSPDVSQGSEPLDDSLSGLVVIIADGVAQLDATALRTLLSTGIPATPQPAEIPELPEIELPASMRDLLASLRDDTELGGISALARDVMATLSFPRRPEEDSELPEGGFSDLTNRGTPDRLLLSELAADPLLLAVRVSLNEALYLRRETPRRAQPRRAAVLVDVGLRQWGLPRPFAWAVALALMAKQESTAEVTLWCTNGNQAIPLRSGTKEDLQVALGRLDSSADPVLALTDFFSRHADQQREREAESASSDIDYFFITHRDTLSEPGFWRRAEQWPPLYLAQVDHEGQFLLEQRTRSARREMARATLKLDALLQQSAVKTIRRSSREPLILHQGRFPVRIAARGRFLAWCCAGPKEWCAITEPRQWVHWIEGDRGCELLAHEVPKGRVVWMDYTEDKAAYALFTEDARSATLVRSASGVVNAYALKLASHPLHGHRFGEILVLVSKNSLSAYSLEDGRMLSHEPEQFSLQDPIFSGRYFSNHFWVALAWDGIKVVPSRIRAGEVALAFESVQGGAYLLKSDGQLIDYSNESLSGEVRIVHPTTEANIKRARLSANRRALFVEYSAECTSQCNGIWDLSQQRFIATNIPNANSWLLPPTPPSQGALINITRVGFTVAQELAIQVNSKRWYFLQVSSAQQLSWVSQEKPDSVTDIVTMEDSTFPSEAWRGTASWPGGAKIHLDHHGLLHLIPVAAEHPEICVNTIYGQVGFWSSDGHRGGNNHLIPDGTGTLVTVAHMATMIAQFIRHASGTGIVS